MSIKEIESIIRKIITTNESIVKNYDSRYLCINYEDTLKKLNELNKLKKELTDELESSMNEFFKFKQNLIFKRLKINSFKLVPSLLTLEYRFSLPKNVDKTSHEYFCYVNMMDRLNREYDCIRKEKDDYFMLNITATLKIDKLIDNNLKK